MCVYVHVCGCLCLGVCVRVSMCTFLYMCNGFRVQTRLFLQVYVYVRDTISRQTRQRGLVVQELPYMMNLWNIPVHEGVVCNSFKMTTRMK